MNISKKNSRIQQLFLLLLLLLSLYSQSLYSQTIAEKKQGLQRRGGGADLDPQSQQLLEKVNQELSQKKIELNHLYSTVSLLHEQDASTEKFHELSLQISKKRTEIKQLEEQWQQTASQINQGEGYALWHQPETTLEQLVIDYGSQDYVYLIPPEIAEIKLSVGSNLAIPRASWNEMLELILMQNGVGIRQLNPYLRELYLLQRTNCLPLMSITNQRKDLELYPSEARVAFVISPEASNIRRAFLFLQGFVNPYTTRLQLIGRDILIVGQISDIQDLLKLYDFIICGQSNKEYKLISLSRVKAADMAKILGAVFDQMLRTEETHGPQFKQEGVDTEWSEANGLKVVVLSSMSQALFLIGSKEEIQQAETLIRDLENQFKGGREKTIYWYTVKHSNAEELATVLDKIYRVMIQENVGCQEPPQACCPPENAPPPMLSQVDQDNLPNLPRDRYNDDFYEQGNVAVDPAPVTLVPVREPQPPGRERDNFIVDIKTGAIVMVVEQDILPKIQEVIKKLDVPKKMVQIEVLLFEKKICDQNHYGLNLLRIGDQACDVDATSLTFNNIVHGHGHKGFGDHQRGILDFCLSRAARNGIAAYDIAYKFLLTQDDVQINANPSVITVNQTPAKVAIVEEFSLNTGVVEIETNKGVSLKDSFTRGQYGITLEITPTIHMRDDKDNCNDDDGINYITLVTNVNFDTIQPDITSPNRPVVTRRNIHNEVLIPDGQTVILGGLRRKHSQDHKDSIPFLGEIPGFGKLFSMTCMNDQSTEMFIFITPKIVADPCEDLERVKYEQLLRRPGDIPDFLVRLADARECERQRLFSGYMTMLFGRPADGFFKTHTCHDEENTCVGEYDGR